MPDVTITGTATNLKWQGGDPPDFVVESNEPFVSSAGAPTNKAPSPFFLEAPCTVNGAGHVVVPTVTLASTEDSSRPQATYRARFRHENELGGVSFYEFGTFGRAFRVPAEPTPTTWADIEANMAGDLPPTSGDRTVYGDFHVTGDAEVDGDTTFDGAVSFNGPVTGAVKSFNGRGGVVALLSTDLNGLDGSGLVGVGSGTGGVANTGSTSIDGDTDEDGVGVVALRTRNQNRLVVNNDGSTKFHNVLGLPRLATINLPTPADSGWLAELTDGPRGLVRYSGAAGWVHVTGWVRPEDHGALGDGTTDDTAAINAAIAAADAAKMGVEFRARVYRVGTVTWLPTVPLRGVRYDTFAAGVPAGTGTVLRSNAAVPMLQCLNPASVPFASGDITGITFDGGNTGTSGLDWLGVQRFKVERCSFLRFTLQGIKLRACLMGEFVACLFNQNVRGAYVTSDTIASIGTLPPNNIHWVRCYWQVNSAWACDLNNGARWEFDDNDWELNGTNAVTDSGMVKVTNPAPNGEGLGVVVSGWSEQNYAFALVRLGPPGVAFVRHVIRDFIDPLGSQLHGVYCESGGSALQYQIVVIENSSIRGSATSDITTSGANVSVATVGVVYDTDSLASGSGIVAVRTVKTTATVPSGDYTGAQYYGRTETGDFRSGVQHLVNGAGLDYHTSYNAVNIAGVWKRTVTTLPSYNWYISGPADLLELRRVAAGSGDINWGSNPLMRFSPPASGETSLWVIDGATGVTKRVKATAAGAVAGVVGKVLYID